MTPWWGADLMQPIISLTAARISRSNTSTLVLAVAGSQAAARVFDVSPDVAVSDSSDLPLLQAPAAAGNPEVVAGP